MQPTQQHKCGSEAVQTESTDDPEHKVVVHVGEYCLCMALLKWSVHFYRIHQISQPSYPKVILNQANSSISMMQTCQVYYNYGI